MEKNTLSKVKTDHSALGGILVLIGGVLALVFSVSRLAITLFMQRFVLRWVGNPMMGERWDRGGWAIPHMARGILGFVAIGAVVGLVLGIVAIYAYTRVKRDKVKNGGLIAIVVGTIMLVSMNWIAGVMTLVGGIICYVSKPATPNSAQSQREIAST